MKSCFATTFLLFLFSSQLAFSTDEHRVQKFNAIIQEYEQEIKKDPKNLRLILAVAEVYYSLKEYSKAVEYYSKALELDSRNNKIKTSLALAYLNNNDLKNSSELFNQVLQEEPSNLNALGGLGRIASLTHQNAKAENYFNQVLSKDPNHFVTLFYLAELRIEDKRYKEAEGILDNLLKQDPHAEWIQLALKRARAGPLLEKADKLEASGDYVTPIAMFKKELEADPDNLEMLLGLAKIYTKIGNYADAIALLQNGLKRFPEDESLSIALGFTYLAKKDLVNAEIVFANVLKKQPRQSEAIAALGRIAVLSGHVRKAERLYQRSLALNPLNTLALSYLAQLRMDQKRYPEAKQLYEQIVQLDPTATWAKQAIGDAELGPALEVISQSEAKNDFEKVESLYNELLADFPNNVNNYILFEQFYRKQKRYPQAIAIALRGLKIDPESPPLQMALGYDYLFNGNLQQSQKHFQEVLDRDPANTEALAGLGRVHELIGDEPSAHNFYEWALQLNPKALTALSFLIDLDIAQKNYPEAKRLAKRLVRVLPRENWAKETLSKALYGRVFDEIHTLQAAGQGQEAMARLHALIMTDPTNESAYLELGHLYSDMKRYPEAIYVYKQGLQNNPSANQLRVNLGLTYIAMKDLVKARQTLRTAFKNDPKNADAIAGLGKVAELKGDKDQAQKYYQTALNIDANNLLALSYLANFMVGEKQFSQAQEVYQKILQIKPDAKWAKNGLENTKFAPLLAKAEEYEKIKNFSEAEATYHDLIAIAPHNATYYIKLGKMYIALKRYQEAITLYIQALEVIPTSIDLQLALGFAYLDKGDLISGRNVFDEILAKEPENPEALAGFARYEELDGNKKAALHLYQKALSIDPNNITAMVYLANVLYDTGFYQEAQNLYKKLLKLQPEAHWVKLAIKDAKHGPLLAEIKETEKVKDYKAADALWQQLIRMEPNYGPYYLRMGLFYQFTKEYEKAINVYDKGIQIDPTSTELYSALGLSYLSLKKYEKAHQAFTKSLKLDPQNPDALAGLGFVAMVQENYPKAEELIKKALKIDSDRIAALSAYGDLMMREKKYQEAQKTFRHLLDLRPGEKWIQLSLEDAMSGHKLDEIRELIKDEQFEEAATIYRELLQKFPSNSRFYYGLGQMLMRLKQYGESIAINKEGLEKNPEENELRVALGYAYFFNGDLSEARDTLMMAHEADHKNPEALAGLGRVNALEDDFDTAEIFYQKALDIDPKNLSALSFYADMLMKQRRFREAQEMFAKIGQILPDAEWVQRSWQDAVDGPVTMIANSLADQEKFELAARLYRQLIDASPNDPARYLPLGQMYVNMQQYCCGIEIFEEGLEIDPEAWYLWRAIGFTYILMSEFCAAESIFEYLVEEDPNDAESWAGLGRIQALDGSICLAEEYINAALAIDSKNFTALSYLADLRESEGYNFCALETYDVIYEVADKNRAGRCEPLPKWIRRGYNQALNLTFPTLNLGGAYHEEDQWDPTLRRWSAEYLVYGGKALINYPIDDVLTVWGSVADQFFELKDLINHNHIYSFDVQRFHIGARWIYSPCLFFDAKAGFSDYSPYRHSTFRMKTGTIGEPSFTATYHLPTEKATMGVLTSSDLIARNFNTNVAKLVDYYTLFATYEWKILKRGWVGLEADAYWFHDFVHNNSQRALGWFQWRPPYYSDNILFRYFVKCQTFAKNIPDYYTYTPQVVNQLQVTLEKFWRVCWADSFYTSLSYGHGWQDTRTRFTQIIVINPGVRPPITWDRRQFNIVFGTIIYKWDRLQATLAADYYRDTEKYTIWSVAADFTWRF